MKVTEIEVHEIGLPYHDWIAYELGHYYGPTRRMVCIAQRPASSIAGVPVTRGP